MGSALHLKKRLVKNCCVSTIIFVVAMVILPLTASDERGPMFHLRFDLMNKAAEQSLMIPKTTPSFSEPEVLIFFGSALIGAAGFARRGLYRK